MNSDQFLFWLKGFLSAKDNEGLTADNVKKILETLDKVSNSKQQSELNTLIGWAKKSAATKPLDFSIFDDKIQIFEPEKSVVTDTNEQDKKIYCSLGVQIDPTIQTHITC